MRDRQSREPCSHVSAAAVRVRVSKQRRGFIQGVCSSPLRMSFGFTCNGCCVMALGGLASPQTSSQIACGVEAPPSVPCLRIGERELQGLRGSCPERPVPRRSSRGVGVARLSVGEPTFH